MKNSIYLTVLFIIFIGIYFISCGRFLLYNENEDDVNEENNSNEYTQNNPRVITLGTTNHIISNGNEQWFKFNGTGSSIVFETIGNIVDTYIIIFEEKIIATSWSDDNSGDGYNALYAINTTFGLPYFIKIETRNNTYGSYNLVVTEAISNIRTNPMIITTGSTLKQTIIGGYIGQHWFKFIGTGENVIFESIGNVVNTNIELYIEDETRAVFSNNKKISISTVIGKNYFIKIYSLNSGTYSFNIINGIGNGKEMSFSIPIEIGHNSFYTVNELGEEYWFSILGTGNTIVFETQGNTINTFISIFPETNTAATSWTDNDSGEGLNAKFTLNTTYGILYFIKVESYFTLSGSYSFIVY